MVQLIIGHVTTSTAKIWVKSEENETSATVLITTSDGSQIDNSEVQFSEDKYYTGIKEFAGLCPDTRYICVVSFKNGSTVEGSFLTMPETAEAFNFLLGSCHFSQGTDHWSPEFKRIGEIAAQDKSRFLINAGDQIYIDTVIRPYWVNSIDGYAERYTETWHSEPLKKLFGNLPQYMIIDDHEIFNNFSNDGLDELEENWLDWAVKTYQIFQHSHNPDTPPNKFHYSFDCAHASFFVLDTRTGRQGNNMLSKEQLTDFKNWLNKNTEPGKIKIIVTSVPLITQVSKFEVKDKWSDEKYIAQRDEFVEILMQSHNKKMVILSGDIHLASHTWLSYKADGHTYRINELISSPIKQIQSNLLHHPTPEVLNIGGKDLPYFLGNHMGYPVKPGEDRHALRNNIMSITVKQNSLLYKVYAVNGDKLLFEDEVIFDETFPNQ